MKQQNISVKKIQEYLNLACVQSVYHWLDGTSMPTIDNLYALSELFELPLDYLVCGNREYKGARNISSFNTRMMEYYIRIVEAA
jgi:transcriptional regulator with XRE-family HTH domain